MDSRLYLRSTTLALALALLALPWAEANTLYLPILAQSASICAPNAQEDAIAGLMVNDPDQQRPSLSCDPILGEVARARAEDMGLRGYFSHVNPDGFGANYLVQQAGYILPSFYDQSPPGNNIESIAAGYSTAADAWDGWMASEAHRAHLLGIDPFWAEQVDYAVGYAYIPGSPYGYYWVVLTARRGP